MNWLTVSVLVDGVFVLQLQIFECFRLESDWWNVSWVLTLWKMAVITHWFGVPRAEQINCCWLIINQMGLFFLWEWTWSMGIIAPFATKQPEWIQCERVINGRHLIQEESPLARPFRRLPVLWGQIRMDSVEAIPLALHNASNVQWAANRCEEIRSFHSIYHKLCQTNNKIRWNRTLNQHKTSFLNLLYESRRSWAWANRVNVTNCIGMFRLSYGHVDPVWMVHHSMCAIFVN